MRFEITYLTVPNIVDVALVFLKLWQKWCSKTLSFS